MKRREVKREVSRLMRPSRLVPLAVVAAVCGLTMSGVAGASASYGPGSEQRAHGTGSETGHSTPPTMPEKVVGSGQENVYSTEGRALPTNLSNPGQYLYVQGCSTCHGVDLAGTDQGPPLIGVGAAAVDFFLSSGRMPLNQPLAQAPRKQRLYNDEQRAQIVEYVSKFGDGPPIPEVKPEEGDKVEGYRLYANNCAACHNSAGSGGALGRNYYAPRLDPASPLEIAEAIRVGPGAMPVFGPDTLSDQEVNSIVHYVGELKEQHGPGGLNLGRLGPVSEGFFAWIVGLGILLAFTRWIGTRI